MDIDEFCRLSLAVAGKPALVARLRAVHGHAFRKRKRASFSVAADGKSGEAFVGMFSIGADGVVAFDGRAMLMAAALEAGLDEALARRVVTGAPLFHERYAKWGAERILVKPRLHEMNDAQVKRLLGLIG